MALDCPEKALHPASLGDIVAGMTPTSGTPPHTIDEALAKFDLIAGVGDGEKTACAMSLLAWIDGCDGWTDAPECVHRLVRENVIGANDHSFTTPEMRAELVRAGQEGILDTWWIPDSVIVGALVSKKDEPCTVYERMLTAINRLAAWKLNKTRANLTGAYLTGANLMRANLTGANLTGANLTRAYLTGADLTDANRPSWLPSKYEIANSRIRIALA